METRYYIPIVEDMVVYPSVCKTLFFEASNGRFDENSGLKFLNINAGGIPNFAYNGAHIKLMPFSTRDNPFMIINTESGNFEEILLEATKAFNCKFEEFKENGS